MNIIVSSVTKPKPVEELMGLVYGVTPKPVETGVVWYMRPAPLSIAAGAVCILLNAIFW